MLQELPAGHSCAICHASLPPGAEVDGLCPACLLKTVLDSAPDGRVGGDRTAASTEVGSTVGPFHIIDVLGRGGMSAVYAAYEEQLDREVALKVLSPELLHDESFGRRLQHEARVVAGLEHANIVPIYGSGIDGGIAWISMRLLTGGTVGDVLTREGGRLPVRRAIEILGDVAGALDYAHERGIVHRDIKPTNILLDHDGRASVADFGLAHVMHGAPGSMTLGAVAGTPEYMSPEQAQGKPIDHRSDVYSLGVVAYEMLTARAPFSAADPLATLLKHVHDRVPVPSRRDVSRRLFGVVQKAMAKRAEDRWPSATAFVDALDRALSPALLAAPRMTRAAWAAAASAVGAAAILGTIIFSGRAGPASPPTGKTPSPPVVEPIASLPSPLPQSPPPAPVSTLTITNRRSGSVVPPSGPSVRRESVAEAAATPGSEEGPPRDRVPAGQTEAPVPRVEAAKPETDTKTERPLAAAADLTPPQPSASGAQTSDTVTPPVRIKTVQPTYPTVALSAGIEGTVVLAAVIGLDGAVTSVAVVQSAHPLLDEAAKRAVTQYLYEPARRNGAPLTFTVQVPVVFKLQ